MSETAPDIYTVGYLAGWTPDGLRALAERVGGLVVDVRLVPSSRIPTWRAKALQAALGEAYVWVGEWGNTNYRSGGPVRLKAFQRGFERVQGLTSGHRAVVLVCACRDVAACHRKVVAERLAEAWGSARLEHLGRPVDLKALVREVLERLDGAKQALEQGRMAQVVERWRALDGLAGSRLTVAGAQGRIEGDYLGIDDDGALLLRDAGGEVQRLAARSTIEIEAAP